jgi:disulfide bond formation protein DsbB
MKKISFRTLSVLGFLGCVAAMLFAVIYLQRVLGLEPCPMCIFQRVAMMATGAVFLLGALHAPRGSGRWFYALLAALTAGAGIGIAARHVWLQSLPPDQVPACGPTLDYLINMFPWKDVVTMVLRGDANCAKIDGQFLGLSLPFWTMLTFVALCVYALALPLVADRRRPNELR